jgi:hypothetical protein
MPGAGDSLLIRRRRFRQLREHLAPAPGWSLGHTTGAEGAASAAGAAGGNSTARDAERPSVGIAILGYGAIGEPVARAILSGTHGMGGGSDGCRVHLSAVMVARPRPRPLELPANVVGGSTLP